MKMIVGEKSKLPKDIHDHYLKALPTPRERKGTWVFAKELVASSDWYDSLWSDLLESYPPQCGGDRIDLLGFDACSVPNSKTPQRRSEIGTARWTDTYITVTGVKGSGGLAEVQLSTEASTTQQGPGASAPTDSNPWGMMKCNYGKGDAHVGGEQSCVPQTCGRDQ